MLAVAVVSLCWQSIVAASQWREEQDDEESSCDSPTPNPTPVYQDHMEVLGKVILSIHHYIPEEDMYGDA